MSRRPSRLKLEPLGERICPAFLFSRDALGNMLLQGDPKGAVSIQLVADETYRIVSGVTPPLGPPVVVSGSGNFTIRLTSNTADSVTVDLNGFSMGNGLTISTAFGDDSIDIVGGGGTIPGSVSLTGPTSVTVDQATIGGNLTVNQNAKNLFSFYTLNETVVGGNLRLTGGNDDDTFLTAGGRIDGSVYLSLGNRQNIANMDSTTPVGGNFVYTGGTANDTVSLDGAIGGSATLKLGNAENLNEVFLSGSVGKNFTVVGGTGSDNVTANAGSWIGGSVSLSLGLAGLVANVVDFQGAVGGPSFTYVGGSGRDELTLGGSMSGVRAKLSLFEGNDAVTLQAADISYLYADMGTGADSFSGFVPFRTYVRDPS